MDFIGRFGFDTVPAAGNPRPKRRVNPTLLFLVLLHVLFELGDLLLLGCWA